MTVSAEQRQERTVEFSSGELTGALGDSVTVLPLVVAVAALTDYALSTLLLGFAVFQVVWGLHYGHPVSVEPMKALAALVVAGSLSASELAGSGLLAGGALLVMGRTGTLGRIRTFIGEPVVRGIQLAVALLLLRTGVELGRANAGLAVVAVVIGGVVVLAGHRRASALVVLGVGVAVAATRTGLPTPAVPALALAVPPVANMRFDALLQGTVAQLAMTVGNAAVATSLLLSDYFDADVSADQLATSMGVMNLLAVPLGAMPMCHGSGGVAGKYAFGARSAGSNVILGVLYALAALFAVSIVAAFPLAMLGVILALVAAELARTSLRSEHVPLTLGIGLLGLFTNIGIALVIGVVAYYALQRRSEGRPA